MYNSIEELKEQAQELIDLGNSKEKAEGHGMMKVIDALNFKYTLRSRSVTWGVEDFEYKAKEEYESFMELMKDEDFLKKKIMQDDIKLHRGTTSWEQVYDKNKFEEALEEMIYKHDACYGITWDTVVFYLKEVCLIKK